MEIRRIEIEDIKGLRRVVMEVPGPGWHVVLGENGSGKTTLVRAVVLGVLGGEAIFTAHVATPTIGHDHGHIYIINKNSSFSNINVYMYGIKTNHNHDGIYFSSSFGPFRRLTGGTDRHDKLYTSHPHVARHLSAFGEDVALTSGLEWLKRLAIAERFGKRDAQLRERLTRFLNESGLLPGGARVVDADDEDVYAVDGAGVRLPVRELSDGFRSVLALAFELLRQLMEHYGEDKVLAERDGRLVADVPGVVLIDEVDAHLHPSWQNRIGGWFIQHFPQIQFIVTTHSPLICRSSREQDRIWRLVPADGSGSNQAIAIEGLQKKRLIYGDLIEALASDGFGLPEIGRSEAGKQKLRRLAELRRKRRAGLTPEEQEELLDLSAVFLADEP